MSSSDDTSISALTEFLYELVFGINDKVGVERSEAVTLHFMNQRPRRVDVQWMVERDLHLGTCSRSIILSDDQGLSSLRK